MAPAPLLLPAASTLSPSLASFLDKKLSDDRSLSQTSTLVSELESDCSDLDRCLRELNSRLESRISEYAGFSDGIHRLAGSVGASLGELRSLTAFYDPRSDGGERKKILGEELPALAKEVARVETVRAYAETALKLDGLIGDVEEAVSSALRKSTRNPSALNLEEVRQHAIRMLQEIEDSVTQVSKARPQWSHLLSAVDHRVDRALAIIRPQAIADHRAFLSSLGWPPPLSSSASSDVTRGHSAAAVNPLSTMQGEQKQRYCKNFLSLCQLQELQRKRKFRQLKGQDHWTSLHQPLWAVEELANPIALACECHFSKWVDKPEFIFALGYKITSSYVDCMDELLQPLVDEAMLSGYSCREEWIASMVTGLATYLAKDVFPIYVAQIGEESVHTVRSPARTSWLHLIDLMMDFDKRIRSLIENSGTSLSLMEEETLLRLSCLSVFNDRPDWLVCWAEIEASDVLEKLKMEMGEERYWTNKIKGTAFISILEDFKAPSIADTFLQHLSAVIDRSRSLPSIPLKEKYLRLIGARIIRQFLDCLMLRCQEAEGLTALTDDIALVKVLNSVNTCSYTLTVLREWCEDVFFIEMGSGESEHAASLLQRSDFDATTGSSVLDEEIKMLEEFQTEWVGKISIVILRGFEVCCRDYVKNRKQWQEKTEEGWAVSASFVESLDYLRAKISLIEGNLNGLDFATVWRKVAHGIDQFLSSSLLLSNVKFHDSGVQRFGCDMELLFTIFGGWCLRPEGFFPKVSEGLKLMKMAEKQLKDCLARGQQGLKDQGISYLRVAEAEKIYKSRLYKG
ncbi:hypothetical protein MLD38_032771 [Melastoma candidum]|uniref:Uncharacterized protein n=1 Tax=Melastoma candidum TaxID=119954 RepID=A0ACB9M4T4_9MYRT|nr:hypothetical protein MLD38_032771 [Melastoma candidum]